VSLILHSRSKCFFFSRFFYKLSNFNSKLHNKYSSWIKWNEEYLSCT